MVKREGASLLSASGPVYDTWVQSSASLGATGMVRMTSDREQLYAETYSDLISEVAFLSLTETELARGEAVRHAGDRRARSERIFESIVRADDSWTGLRLVAYLAIVTPEKYTVFEYGPETLVLELLAGDATHLDDMRRRSASLMFMANDATALTKACSIATLWAEQHGMDVLSLEVFSALLRETLITLARTGNRPAEALRDKQAGDMRLPGER